MNLILFFAEVIIVSILIFLHNHSSEPVAKETLQTRELYNSYYAFTPQKTVLVLHNTPSDKKLTVWENSYLHAEMMQHFPHIELITQYIHEHIDDNGEFKMDLIEHMEYIHGEYLAGNINQKCFQKAATKPDPLLPAY